jgi:uncharacterized PurR-regulated membrane protein YhhQ (DUF165 family)
MKILIIFLYLFVILLSNVLTAKFKPIQLNDFIIPLGTFFIGFNFVLRDYVQNIIGKNKIYIIIFTAMFLSALTSIFLGDTLWIVSASIVTFLFSESSDTEIYSRLKFNKNYKILISGIISGIIDSALFVIIGLSPIGANFIPWENISNAILSQIVVKILIQIFFILIIIIFTNENKKRYHETFTR